ncbi:MAG: hypothetical protein WCJ33_07805, partial [Pseudomonadota bacterium]
HNRDATYIAAYDMLVVAEKITGLPGDPLVAHPEIARNNILLFKAEGDKIKAFPIEQTPDNISLAGNSFVVPNAVAQEVTKRFHKQEQEQQQYIPSNPDLTPPVTRSNAKDKVKS